MICETMRPDQPPYSSLSRWTWRVRASRGLSTFGIGTELSVQGWRELIEQLLFEGLLREDPNDGRPLIGVGDADAVRAVFRGERRVMTQTRAEAPAKAKRGRKARETLTLSPADQPLFEALRAWRAAEAKSQHVPPYVIFHDRTLAEIAVRRPGTRVALAEVSGVGEGKLERYGEAVLKVLAEAG